MRTVDIMGFSVSGDGLSRVVETALGWARSGGKLRYMACANAHSLALARRDERFGDALRHADQLLPDGVGVLLAARVLGHRIDEKIAGMDFFTEFSRLSDKHGGVSYFLLGSTPTVLEQMVARLAGDYPAIEIAGSYSPPFKAEFSADDTAAMVQAVEKARPDVLWIGMTAPKQETWLFENCESLSVSFVGLIGAVFDFYAGTRRRPPAWMRRLGLEWLGRVLAEPRRLWRRLFVSMPQFLFDIFRARLLSDRI